MSGDKDNKQINLQHNRFKFIKNTKKKLLYTPSNEHKVLKAFVGIAAGLVAGGVIFVLLKFSYKFSYIISGAIAGVLTLLFSTSFALSTRGRCIGLLILPSLSTARGRAAIYSVIGALLLSGPITNITDNSEELASSLACGSELAYNKTKELQERAAEQLKSVYDQVKKTSERMKNLGKSILNPLKKAEDAIAAATAKLSDAVEYIKTAAKTCKNGLSSANQRCRKGLNSAKAACLSKIPDNLKPGRPGIPGIPGIGRKRRNDEFQYSTEGGRDILYIMDPPMDIKVQTLNDAVQKTKPEGPPVKRTKRGLREDICNALNIGDSACSSLKEGETICQPISKTKSAISDLVQSIDFAADNFYNQLRFEIDESNEISGSTNSTQTAEEIRANIEEEIRKQTQIFHTIFTWINRFFAVFLIILFIQSFFYLKSFLTKEKFDNIYITRRMKREDLRRKSNGEQSVLPLKKTELKIYIDSTRLRLSAVEKAKFKTGAVTLLMTLLSGIIVISFDFVLYWLMSVVKKHSDVKVIVEGETDIRLDVRGSGIFAIVARSFIEGVREQSDFNSTFDFSVCLPEPSEPNYNIYGIIFACYVIAFTLIITQAYLLRIRRKIAAYFYPEREVERMAYLTNRILEKRKNLKHKLGRLIRKSVKESCLEEKESKQLTNKMGNALLFWKKRKQNVECLACGERKESELVHCNTRMCKGIYCNECFNELERVCRVCGVDWKK